MFYLVREVGKIWRCSCWEKGNFVMINVFKYGETWTSVWPFPISLSLYSTFKHSIFPFCVREQNKLDTTIQDAESIKQFKLMIKTFFFLTNDSYLWYMTKLLTRLQLQFSLNSNFSDHTFHHNFKDCVSPICHCGAETDTAVLPLFANKR